MPRLTLSPASRLAIGLATMTSCLLIALDLAIGLVPDPVHAASRLRATVVESLALRVTPQLEKGRAEEWQHTLARAREANPEILVAALRGADGKILASDGRTSALSPPSAGDRSTIDRIVIPIHRDQTRWGQLEVNFTPVYPQTMFGWLTMPLPLTMLGLLVIGAPLYALYLRRALQLLDPSNAVPDRVRAAFDTLAEGVVVLDKNERVVLANQPFRDMVPQGSPDIIGKRIADLQWLVSGLPTERPTPWQTAIETNESIQDVPLTVNRQPQPQGPDARTTMPLATPPSPSVARYMVTANPITDGNGRRRGCIVTFDDVSALHHKTEELSSALQTLESSRAQIESQNAELQRLASRDPMTDCLNRRAFFEQAAIAWVHAISEGRRLTLAMCDIDFFKRVNDQYGHAAGDQVIKATADWLRSVARSEDLVCRMGGEEFCVLWINLPPDQAFNRADKLRGIVQDAPPIITETGEELKVTMSIGVVCEEPSKWSVEQMLEQADQALYEAKRTGRNRVIQWPFTPAEAVPQQPARDEREHA